MPFPSVSFSIGASVQDTTPDGWASGTRGCGFRVRGWPFAIPVMVGVVAGDSMTPTLCPGDRMLVRRRARVRVGDLVMLRRPDRPSLIVVKRVLGKEKDGWWVEGDNPARSDDSRTFGPVADDLVLGRVIWRYRVGSVRGDQ